MRRLWWPEPLYEMKPYGALALGLLAALLFAGVSIAYSAAILRMRYEYRRRSRWHRERRD